MDLQLTAFVVGFISLESFFERCFGGLLAFLWIPAGVFVANEDGLKKR